MKYKTLCLWGLLVFCFFTRLAYISVSLENDQYAFKDTGMYYSAAKAVVDGDILLLGDSIYREDPFYHGEPLWPFVLSPFAKIAPGNYWWIRLFVTVLLVIAGWFFVQILRRVVDYGMAIFGAGLFLFYPFYFYFSGIMIQEPLVVVLLILMTWALMEYNKTHKNAYYGLLVLFIVLLYYLRVTCIALVPLLLVPLIEKELNKKNILLSFCGGGLFILFLLPWGWRNYLASGEFSLLTRTGQVGLPGNEAAGVINIQENLLGGLAASFFSIPGNFFDYFSPAINNVLSKGLVKPAYNIISIVCVTPLLLSTLYVLSKIKDKKIFLLFCVFSLYSAPYILLFGQTRYRLPVDFIMIIFLVVLLQDMYRKIVIPLFESGFRLK